MSAELQDSVQSRAIEWHIRLRDGDDATWEAFADWIAEDVRHADAYDAIEQADLAIEPLLPHVLVREVANDVDEPAEAPPRRNRHWIIGGTLAASLAAAITVLPALASSRYDVVTGPGERRVIALDASTKVTLNGSTHMTFDRKNPRYASLAAGEAYFQIRHDSTSPFKLEVGDNIVEDAGTIFNVVHESGEVRVAVAEGKVVYNPGANAVSLHAGQALAARTDGKPVQLSEISTNRVGSWKAGILIYSAAPLSQVSQDISRTLGVRVIVAPAISARPFWGTIMLDGSGPDQLERLEPALNVVMEKMNDGWIMKPSGNAGP